MSKEDEVNYQKYCRLNVCFCLLEEVLLLHQMMGECALSCFFDLGFWKASGCVCTHLATSLYVLESLGKAAFSAVDKS
jgi:hypothetical protein